MSILFRKTHDLVYLLELISQLDPDFLSYLNPVSELQGYAVEIRYPNDTIAISDDKIEAAFSTAKEIRDVVTTKMNINISYNEIINH